MVYVKSTLEEYNKCRDESVGSTRIKHATRYNKQLYACEFCDKFLQKKDIEWYYFETTRKKLKNGAYKHYPHKQFLKFCNENEFNLYVLTRL